ncbi:MAG: hypothetical protein A3K19_08115 [Lentisphaerae bacterium RIFOXYB12_FULL_65_16]|nr:MAG: hypothetical protein A3K18_27955 [Lentisphaerae bacterium RIFOXYA12_64_32]OGV84902.1 MAG: hypothetical protein A3K19_08115 [Lentisphaerae bacterium RIFOXYB12_FULL_65_16]
MNAGENQRLKLFLPADIDTVVGDTLEIFYESLTSAVTPLRYNIVTVADKGRSYHLKWVYTAQPGDKDFPLSIRYYDDFGNLVGQADTTVRVQEKAVSPPANVNILCLGASCTAGGEWVTEVQRRLCGTGGSPEGLGLTNITFIGSCGRKPARFEAYGGWTWNSYLANASASPNAWVYVLSGMKTDPATQHSVWADSNHNQWQLETLDAEGDRLKFKPYPPPAGKPTPLPPEGVLTWVSGGADSDAIRYAGTQPEKGNPFWSVSRNAVSFGEYLARNKIEGGIDLCLIGLGGNDIFCQKDREVSGADFTAILRSAKTFLDALHAEFPRCRVVISSLQLPDVDGYGENYDCKTPISNAFALKNAIIDMGAAYQGLAASPEYSSYVGYVNLACQYDGRNGGRFQERPASQRSPVREPICINALHPSKDGYMMIADAWYRKIIASLNQQ